MRMASKVSLVAAVLAVVAALAMAPAYAGGKATVGDFLVRLAQAKHLGAATPQEALQALRSAGLDLPRLDLKAALTEGTVVAISNRLGIQVTTSNPDAELTQEQVDRYFAAFGDEVRLDNPPDPDPDPDPEVHKPDHGTDPLQKGKGKKKGLRSPDDPV